MVLLAGLAGSILLYRYIGLAFSKPVARLYNKLNRLIEITSDSLSVRVFRAMADLVPLWLWQLLTWTLFILGYVSKSVSTWSQTPMYLAHFLVLTHILPTQQLMVDAGWYIFTFAQGWQMCWQDYQAYLQLGGGGTPQTWNGFKRITLLGWFGRINTLEPPHSTGKGYLEDLESRAGERPRVVGIAPQRQLEERSPKRVYDNLLAYLDHLSAKHASRIHTATSFLEKHAAALLTNPASVGKPIFRIFGGEIVHPHQIDGSLHCMLHPADVEKVIGAGWGERHAIARADFWWMW